MTTANATTPFRAGDHLRVWRRLGPIGYYHHGVYIGDGLVVQFGGRISDKRHGTVGTVPLAVFEGKGAAKLFPPADAPGGEPRDSMRSQEIARSNEPNAW